MLKDPSVEIRSISSEQTFAIRHPVLRAGRPLESSKFAGDNEKETHHFGAYTNNKLIGVLSCYQNNCSLLMDGKNYQIRGVAVLESHQKKGIGKALMLHAEEFLSQINCNHIWLNARLKAKDFYTKLCYEEIGTVFEVVDIGPHQCFIKKLS